MKQNTAAMLRQMIQTIRINNTQHLSCVSVQILCCRLNMIWCIINIGRRVYTDKELTCEAMGAKTSSKERVCTSADKRLAGIVYCVLILRTKKSGRDKLKGHSFVTFRHSGRHLVYNGMHTLRMRKLRTGTS